MMIDISKQWEILLKRFLINYQGILVSLLLVLLALLVITTIMVKIKQFLEWWRGKK